MHKRGKRTPHNHTGTMNTTNTVTVTLTVSEIKDLMRAAADSGCYWHHLWQDCIDGKRDDLDAETCITISRRGWALRQRLGEMV